MAQFQTFAFICCFLLIESFKSHFLSQAFFTGKNEDFGEIPVEELLQMGKFGAARRITAREHLPQDIPIDLEAYGHALTLVDRLIEPQTIIHFIVSCLYGDLPDGTNSTLPLITEDEAALFGTPFSVWAPAPFNKLPSSIVERMMMRVGSYEDGDRLVLVEKNVHAMKSRLWEGIIPMSKSRWQQKELDDPKNHILACQHLTLVVDVFTYLNTPSVYYRLSETYNLIYDELIKLDRALNALRASKSENAVVINTTGLWLEYFIAHFRNMETRAHTFVYSHIDRMRDIAIEEMLSIQTPMGIDEHLKIADRLHDLAAIIAAADYRIMIPLDCWRGYTTPASGRKGTLVERAEKYITSVKIKTREKEAADLFSYVITPVKTSSYSQLLAKTCRNQITAQDEARLDMRGEKPELGLARYVVDVKSNLAYEPDPNINWGYVAYRLSYTETDEEWATFVMKCEEDAAQWSDGITGAEDIKDFAKILWLNGQDFGIPEDDIAAAKEHFAIFKETPSLIVGLTPEVFLAADHDSIASFLSPSSWPKERQTPGDFGGYVIAVDAKFDPDEPNSHAEESPDFSGEFRILASLLYGDLWAMIESENQSLENLWPLAMVHPLKVYVGPNVKAEREVWDGIVTKKVDDEWDLGGEL